MGIKIPDTNPSQMRMDFFVDVFTQEELEWLLPRLVPEEILVLAYLKKKEVAKQ